MKAILLFLVHPDLNQATNNRQKLRCFWWAFLFSWIALIVRSIIYSIENILVTYADYEPIFLGISHHYQIDLPGDATYNLLVMGLYAPVLEEILYRGGLTFRRNGLALVASGVFFLATKEFIEVHKILLRLLVSLPFVGLAYLISHYGIPESWLLYARKQLLRPVLYVSILLFTTIHIPNYDTAAFNMSQWLVFPLYLLPLVASGLAYAFLRVRNGLFWSLAIHVLHNAIIILFRAIA